MQSRRYYRGLGALCAAAVAVTAFAPASRAAIIIPTNLGLGADAEVREDAATSNRGASTELASRIIDRVPGTDGADPNDRNSLMYVRFDISGVTAADLVANNAPRIRLTYRNNSLTQGRVEQTVNKGTVEDPVMVTKRAGLSYYALDINDAGNNWGESTITYNNAPGLLPDGNIGTKDYDPSKLTFLGSRDFPTVTPANWHPVGGAFDFEDPTLNAFLASAVAAGKETVTFLIGVQHDGDPDFNNLTNFNYLFNPKEMLTLNNDPNHDPDVNDPFNPTGSPWSGASNANGQFSPQLILVPEPGSLALLGAAGLALLRRRR